MKEVGRKGGRQDQNTLYTYMKISKYKKVQKYQITPNFKRK